MLPPHVLQKYIEDACSYASEKPNDKTLWLYEKYISLMEDTQNDSPYPEGSPQYWQDVMIMLSCVSARIFRTDESERLEDLRIAYRRSGRDLDEMASPFKIAELKMDKEIEVMIPPPIEEPSQSIGSDEVTKDHELTNSEVTVTCKKVKECERVKLLENKKFQAVCQKRISDALKLDNGDDNIEMKTPQPSREPSKVNLFSKMTRIKTTTKDKKRLHNNCYDMSKLECYLHSIDQQITRSHYWNSNLLEYDKLLSHPEDAMSFAYDQSKIPGIGISMGEARLLKGSGHLNACKWKPSFKMKRFMAIMHKPWFLGEP